MEKKLSRESAQVQIDYLCDWYMIDDGSDSGERTDETDVIRKSLKKLHRAVIFGLVEIEENGDTILIKQNLSRPIKSDDGSSEISQITYAELNGSHKCAVKGDEELTKMEQIYQFLGAMSKEGPQLFKKFRGKDVSIAESVGQLFLLL